MEMKIHGPHKHAHPGIAKDPEKGMGIHLARVRQSITTLHSFSQTGFKVLAN